MAFSFRRTYEIMGLWRIAWLILAAALASVYLAPSVAPIAGYVDSCALVLFLFCGAAFIVLSAFTFVCYIFVAPFPAFLRRDIIPSCFRRNNDGTPKVARPVSVSEECLSKMEDSYGRGVAFDQIVVYPVLIFLFVHYILTRGYEDYMNWRDPNDYGFYLYPVLFAVLAIPWFLLFSRSGRRCPYCLTPRTIDTFDFKHHVCLRCHTQFVAGTETDQDSPAPTDNA